MRTQMAFQDARKQMQRSVQFCPGVLKILSLSITAQECPLIDSILVLDDAGTLTPDFEEIPVQLLQSHGLTTKDWRKPFFEILYQ